MKYLIIFIGCITLASCNQQTERSQDNSNQTKLVNVDSLNAAFVAGWNNKDSVAAVSIIADNAIVMNDTLIHNGINEIAKNWISGGIKVISNINTVSSIKGANESIAYDGGTYTLDLTIPGGPVLKEKGNYSLVWTKTKMNDWKLTLIHIEDISRMPDIK
jgi:ketosteroid isomerase-like protein